MPHASWIPEADCAIAQSLGVFGDAWDLLIVRDLARGHHRFEQLTAELGISRKVLTERLRKLESHAIVHRLPYQDSPRRNEYHLTARGLALVPVLVALQDWGDRWLLGDGTPTGLGSPSADHRVHALVGTVVPRLRLPATSGSGDPVATSGPSDRPGAMSGLRGLGEPVATSGPSDLVATSGPSDLVATSGPSVASGLGDLAGAATTVLFGFPGTGGGPWNDVPGAMGCTLENRLFRAAYPRFVAAGVAVVGVSTQRPDEQAALAAAEDLPFPLLSDADLLLTAALRLPTFQLLDVPRLRRFALVIGADRVVREVHFPVTDIPALIDQLVDRCRSSYKKVPGSCS